MTVFWIIAAAVLVVGLGLYIHDRLTRNNAEPANDTDIRPDAPTSDTETTEECCGMHITCEHDSLLASVSNQAEYFDDEELDRFAGRLPDSYTADETEEFRDVLLTLRPEEIAPWARSIQLRGIELPSAVREELLMIVAEARQAHETANRQ